MSILYRYLARSVVMATLGVVALVMSLTFFIGLLTELRDVGTGDYGFPQAILHVLLQLPNNIYQFFPMCMLLGGIVGLGILTANNELMVMRASGISMRKIIFSVLSAACMLVMLVTLLGEGIAPKANFIADTHKDSEENNGQAVLTASGVWIHQGNNFLQIKRVIGQAHLEGVTRYEFDDAHHLLATYFAESLDYVHQQWTSPEWVKTTFGHEKTSHQHFTHVTWDLTLNPNQINVGFIEPSEMSLTTLAHYTAHLKRNKTQATDFEFAFWKRLLQPLATLVMILLAVPFVFGPPRSVTMGWRILLGVLVGFGFYTFNAFLGQMSMVFQLSPFAAALLPIVLFGAVGYGFLVKYKK